MIASCDTFLPSIISALSLACWRPAVRYVGMVAHLASMYTTSRIDPLLKLAVLGNASAAVKIQLRKNLDLNARDDAGQTLLMVAAAKGHADICSILVDAGADILATDRASRNAIIIAREAGFLSLAIFLENRVSHIATNGSSDPNLPIYVNNEIPDAQFVIEPSEWEADEPSSLPESNNSPLNAVVADQLKISNFVPVDTSEDWADVRIKLPDLPRRKKRKARFSKHQKSKIFRLFCDGIRNGCLPLWRIETTISEINGEHDELLQSKIQIVLDDLGVGIEEHDYWNWYSSQNRTPLSKDEMRLARTALRFFNNLANPRLDPLDLYYQEIKLNRLLTHEEEIQLGDAKENAIEDAVTAISQTKAAIAEILRAADLVAIGKMPLKHISLSSSSSETDRSDTIKTAATVDSSQDGFATPRRAATFSEFSQLILAIKSYVAEWPPAKPRELRVLLCGLHLSWHFISEMSKKVQSFNDSSGEPSALEAAVRNGQNARSRLAVSNLRLVISIAKSFWHHGFPISDLIQEGSIGLLRAIDRYDHRLGFRFSTYATWWIRQFMQRAIYDQSRLIRIPVFLIDLIRKVQRVAEKTDGTADTWKIAAYLGVPVENIERAFQARRDIISLNAVFDPNNTNLVIMQMAESNADDLFTQQCIREYITNIICDLSPRDRNVLCLRFGIGEEREHTLEEIGIRFNVTRERIRQIEKRALMKLSESPSTRSLRDCLDGYTNVNNGPSHAHSEDTNDS
jgi:RNA polymerase primary sigma factor